MKVYFVLEKVDFEDKLWFEVYFVLEMAVFKDKHLRCFVPGQHTMTHNERRRRKINFFGVVYYNGRRGIRTTVRGRG